MVFPSSLKSMFFLKFSDFKKRFSSVGIQKFCNPFEAPLENLTNLHEDCLHHLLNDVTPDNFIEIACPLSAENLTWTLTGNLNDTDLGPCSCELY